MSAETIRIERLTDAVRSLVACLIGTLGEAVAAKLFADLDAVSGSAEPGTISREDAERNSELLDEIELPAPGLSHAPHPTVSLAAQAVADFESYRDLCGAVARTPVPFAVFHPIWQHARRDGLTRDEVGCILRRAEAALPV